jgi:hypothetical protein
MNERWATLIDDIAKLPEMWHAAGSVSPAVLRGIARFADRIGAIHHSAETGAGKTTLLFSHLSSNHLVFAVEAGNGSVSKTKASPLLNSGVVTFVEGPTQVTLPQHRFTESLQMVLLDGPHGYPFPDLEYYYFYPVIQTGGLLIVDDIQIPTIGRMFDIIKAGDMFRLLEVIENTAFMERTDAPLISPTSDSWWLQGYNRTYHNELLAWIAQEAKKANPAADHSPPAEDKRTPPRRWWHFRMPDKKA